MSSVGDENKRAVVLAGSQWFLHFDPPIVPC